MLERLLKIAAGELGQGETPKGSNITKYGAWYPMQGSAWCAMFVSWCAHMAGIPTSVVPKHAYTPTGAKWFYDRGRWGTKPKAGALVYFNWYGPTYQGRWKGICHVGIVEKVEADGSIITIEGNVGDKVQRLRRRTGIAGYGYPDYAVITPPAPPKEEDVERHFITVGGHTRAPEDPEFNAKDKAFIDEIVAVCKKHGKAPMRTAVPRMAYKDGRLQ